MSSADTIAQLRAEVARLDELLRVRPVVAVTAGAHELHFEVFGWRRDASAKDSSPLVPYTRKVRVAHLDLVVLGESYRLTRRDGTEPSNDDVEAAKACPRCRVAGRIIDNRKAPQ